MKNLFLTKTRWLVTIILLTALGIGNVWGDSQTFTNSDINASHTSATKNPITVSIGGTVSVSGQQFRFASGKAMTVTSSSGNITRIDVTTNSTEAYISPLGGKVSSGKWNKTSATKYYWSGDATSVTLTPNSAIRITQVVVTYSAVSCKSISPSLSYASVGGTTLTVGSSSSGSPTITGNTGSGTVTYSSSNTSVATVNSNTGVVTAVAAGNATITASIAAKGDYCEGSATANFTIEAPRYTVSFNTGTGNPTQADITEASAGAGITLPDGPTPACSDDGWVFVGWAESSCSETTTAPELLAAGDEITPESDMTLYAVYRKLTSGTSTATFNAADISNLTTHSTYNRDWRDNTGGIELYISDGQHYTGGSTKTWTVTNGTSNYALVDAHTKISSISITISGTNYKVGSVDKDAGTAKLSTSGTSQTVTCSGDVTQVYLRATSNYQIRMTTFTVTYYNAKFDSNPTCQACVAPTSVTITGTNKYLGGQTISLTATPEGGTGTPSYQWQKKISEAWTNLENDGSISGVTSNNLKISSCSYVNSGGYRCIVSTGDGCETKSHADDTNGYGVHVFSIHGKYTTDADYSDTEIIWTSETTGTATISMDAKKTYLFKVWSNNGNYYGHGANTNEDFMFQPTTWDCGVNNNEMRLFTTVAGNYTFTVNIEHGLDGSPYVNVQVGYPSMTHPNTGYVYVQKFSWTPRLHYWYNDANKLTEWNDDPSLASDQYVNICGTDYWCVPVIDYYCNFIAADHNGQTTGDQHTNSPHPGQRLYNDGSWKWGEFSTYTIAYAGGDGSTGGPMASHTGLCPGSSQQLTANAFSKSGYNFSGWTANVDVKIGGSTVPAGTLITGTPIIENVQSNITLTAQWRDLAQYHVTFSADNGTVAGGASQTVTEGGTLTFPNVTSTTCGTFIGWVEAAYDNTAAPSGATFHEAGSQIDVVAELEGKTYYAVYRVATGMATTLTDNLVPSDFKATGTSYEATNNLVKTSSATYEAVTAKGNNAIQINKISDGRGIVSKISGGIFKGITLTTNANHSASRKVYVYGSSSYTAAYADPAAFNTNSEVRGTLLATLAGDTKTYSTSTDDYEYIAIFADGAAYLDQISLTWYGAPMKYQTSPTCSPMVGVESSFSTFTYAYNAGPSASQSFTISGSNLGADLVVTAPENYEVCKTADGTYTRTIRYTPSDGAVANTTAYIRLAAGLNVGTYNYAAASGLQVTSTGAKTRTAALNGSVTKADCAITFTDFNAVDHYEATLEYGSSVTVSYNYTYNGDGNFSISHSPATGTIDKANKTLTVSVAGIWTLKASATAGTNYSKPSDASAQIRVKCVDTYKDFIHNKTIKAYGSGTAVTDGKMEDWGSGYTVPYIDDNAEETSGSCQQTHYKFMGWVSEDDINIADGTFKTGWTLIQAGTESKLATTKTYYAVWAKLEE